MNFRFSVHCRSIIFMRKFTAQSESTKWGTGALLQAHCRIRTLRNWRPYWSCISWSCWTSIEVMKRAKEFRFVILHEWHLVLGRWLTYLCWNADTSLSQNNNNDKLFTCLTMDAAGNQWPNGPLDRCVFIFIACFIIVKFLLHINVWQCLFLVPINWIN